MSIKTLDQVVTARIYELSDAAHEKFRPSVRPIYGASKGMRPELIGSCLLLYVDGTDYVATAAHIADSIPKTNLYVAGAENTGLVQLVGTIKLTKAPSEDRRKDKLDIAFVPMSAHSVKQLGAVTFIDANDVSHNRANTEHRQYMAIGYPLSRNKRTINQENHSVKMFSWRYVAGVKHLPALERAMGVSGDYHFFQTYDKYSRDHEGGKVSSVNPCGLSGGALVDLGNLSSMDSFESETPFSARLAGMVIERHDAHKALVALHIQKVIEAIQK